METTTLGNCALSASILKNVVLTEDGRIKTSDIEVTQQISSLEYLKVDGTADSNDIVSALNSIIAAFKNETPPEPPIPAYYTLSLKSIANDEDSTPVDGVCTFSPS